MRNLTQALTLTSMATAVRSAFKIASVNPVLWWDAESHRAALTSGGAATLFQDLGGTSAVTAVEQPVGRAVDLSGNARHALQTTSTSRPLLTARKNLGIRTNTFYGAVNTYAPGAYGTLARITKTTSAVTYAQSETQATFVAGTTITVSIRVKWDGYNFPDFSLEYNNAGNFGTQFIARWAVTSSGVSLVTQSACTATAVAEANGVYRLSATFVTGASAAVTSGTNPTVLHRLQGASGATILAGDFQIEYGASATEYQQVVSATSYAIASAPLTLNFDGLDDVLTASFTAGALPSSADVYVVLQRAPDDGASVFVGDNAASRFLGMADANSSDPLVAAGAGSATTWVNGTQVTTLAGTASATGANRVLFHAHDANLSAWTGLAIGAGYYTASGYAYKGTVGAVLITPAQSASTRAKIRKALAKAYQITGVV